MLTLYNLMIEATENAINNGYNVLDYSNPELALDMMTCDAEIESYAYEEVISCIPKLREYFNEKK